MSEHEPMDFSRAISDFRNARQKAVLKQIISRLTGKKRNLLSFEDTRRKLHAQIGTKMVLKEIPLDSIIGSVNRYEDFYRDFLPSSNINAERWVNIELANQGMLGLPPIEAYQVGDAYFVIDGNHRVSVARQLGSLEIQAYVIEVRTQLPLSAQTNAEDLLSLAEYSQFVEKSKLLEILPGADLRVTEPGQYEVLEEHITVHRYFMGIDKRREISYPEALFDWYENFYFPLISIIRENGVLIDFPKRTETDLYLWLVEHRAALEKELNDEVTVTNALQDLVDQFGYRANRFINRAKREIYSRITPELLFQGPPPGTWRKTKSIADRHNCLFCEILVPINGQPDGWYGLDQAISIAKREKTNLHCLFVAPNDDERMTSKKDEIQSELFTRCERESIKCDFHILTGKVAEIVSERARWSDLVVTNLTYPPKAKALSRMRSGIRSLIQKCPRPILFVQKAVTSMDSALLVYDGTPKSREALYIAAYMAGHWNTDIHVLSVGSKNRVTKFQEDTRGYLERSGITAHYHVVYKKDNKATITRLVNQMNIDLLLTGGYNSHPVKEIIFGSQLDEMLRQYKIPILVTR